MSDSDWSEDLAPPPPPKKSGLGKIIAWGCGCGCLLFLIGALVAGVGAAKVWKSGSDQDVQWPRVAEYLPFDERPEDLTVFGFDSDWFQVEWYFLYPSDADEAAEEQDAAAHLFGQLMVMESTVDFEQALTQQQTVRVERDSMELQGRVVDVLWHESGIDVAEDFFGQQGAPRTLAVDLSDDEHTVILQLQSFGAELGRDEIEHFLAPFDLWRDR